MNQFYDHINLLILPTDTCNMNCVYCFHKPYYNDYNKMSIETVKYLLDITTPHYKQINIIWHGGEPLLMGLPFYKEVLELQKKYTCKINNSMQSNLTLLTPEMADFFSKNDFYLSGSYDGVCNESLRGRSKEILAGRKLMVDRGKRCGLIMVVSNQNINQLVESYLFFKSIDVNFSLNLYLDQKNESKSDLSLNKTIAIQRLCELFDYWVQDREGSIHISYFKNILDYIINRKKSLCSYTSCLGRWIGVHNDGKLSPCNRFFSDEFCFGNVYDYLDIRDVFSSDGFVNLLKGAIERREKCKDCKIYDYCNGGCNNVALNENGISNNGGLSCQILMAVYEYISSYIEKLTLGGKPKDTLNPLLVKMINESKKDIKYE